MQFCKSEVSVKLGVVKVWFFNCRDNDYLVEVCDCGTWDEVFSFFDIKYNPMQRLLVCYFKFDKISDKDFFV